MAALANDETQPIELRFQANKEVAQYVEPKRKAVEVSGDDDKVAPVYIFTNLKDFQNATEPKDVTPPAPTEF
jgi:hypothetical protein